MRVFLSIALTCGAALLGAEAAQAQSAPVYVNPRVPIGHLRLTTGHVAAVGGGGGGAPVYVAPSATVVYGLPRTLPAQGARTHVYVVVPDLRVRPSEVVIDPPQITLVPARPRGTPSADERRP